MKFFKINKNKLIKASVLLFLTVMLVYPGASFRGASSGLLLWFHNVLPNLLPFIIISNLIVRLNITNRICKIFYPILGKLLGISSEGCYPIVFGFLSGIPMGAKATADMVSEHKISLKEGQFLFSLCNNASPMFIIGYVAITQLKLPGINYALLVIIYLSAILSALIFRFFQNRFTHTKAFNEALSISNQKPVRKQQNRFSFELLDSSIMNGFEVITKIGGYIILFSILAQIIKETGLRTGIFKALFIGMFEITTGINQVCSTSFDLKLKIVLAAVLTSFGGLSGIAQTKSVLGDTRLSIQSYIIVKIISAFLAFIFAFFYVTCFAVK